MEAKFSQRVKDVLTYSREEALRLGNDYIGLEHLLLGILREGEGLAVHIMLEFGMDLNKLKQLIEEAVGTGKEKVENPDNLPLVRQAERALKITYLEAKLFNSDLIGTEHLLLSILKDEDNVVTRSFEKFGVDYDSVKDELKTLLKDSKIRPAEKEIPQDDISGDVPDEEHDEPSKSYGGGAKR